MQIRTREFVPRATFALHDPLLQRALANAAGGFIGKRAKAVAEVPEFEALRDAARPDTGFTA